MSLTPPSPAPISSNPPRRFLDQVRDALRLLHYSYRTENTYTDWIKRFILFHGKKHPMHMDASEVKAFLTDLAVRRTVSASTQNQALNALVFLYRNVLKMNLAGLGEIPRAHKTKHVPTVLTTEEVRRLLDAPDREHQLTPSLLYGTGMRLMACLRVRVKDVDFERGLITIHEGIQIGTMKRWWDQGYFLMRGLPSVRAEMALTVLSYNLTRAINILGVQRLIAAVS